MTPLELYPIALLFLCVALIWQDNKLIYFKKVNKKKGEVMIPEKMIKEFVNQEVSISMYNDTYSQVGIIKSVEASWIKFETKKDIQIINIDMIKSISLRKTKKSK